MQMGAAAVMVNTAIAESSHIPQMARAFALAVEAGRAAYLGRASSISAPKPSSPTTDSLGFLRD